MSLEAKNPQKKKYMREAGWMGGFCPRPQSFHLQLQGGQIGGASWNPSLSCDPSRPSICKAMVSGPDEAKWGQRRDPQAGAWALQAPISWPPSSLGPHASRTFDLLISSPSSGFIRELPQLMSSPGGRAHMPSRWAEAFTPLGPVF